MSRRSVAALTSDFANVLALLKERKIVPQSPPQALLLQAKHIHEVTYSLILWRFRLRRLPAHSKVFVEEIASDALQVLPQVLTGYAKTAKLLVRGIVENTFRHIYFSDHPVEFERMNREVKWFLTSDALFDYAKNHPKFIVTEPKFNAIAQLSALHSELSAGIHGRTVRDLEMRRALAKIGYDEAAAAIEVGFVQRAARAANFLLAVFHKNAVRTLQMDERRIILRTMPDLARRTWNEFE